MKTEANRNSYFTEVEYPERSIAMLTCNAGEVLQPRGSVMLSTHGNRHSMYQDQCVKSCFHASETFRNSKCCAECADKGEAQPESPPEAAMRLSILPFSGSVILASARPFDTTSRQIRHSLPTLERTKNMARINTTKQDPDRVRKERLRFANTP
jgi:hypothetical protein